MRDFHLSWDVVVGSLVVLVVLCGAYSVSYPQPPPRRGSAGVLWRVRLGPTGVTLPSGQDDGNVRAPVLVCVVGACVLDCARGHKLLVVRCSTVRHPQHHLNFLRINRRDHTTRSPHHFDKLESIRNSHHAIVMEEHFPWRGLTFLFGWRRRGGKRALQHTPRTAISQQGLDPKQA